MSLTTLPLTLQERVLLVVKLQENFRGGHTGLLRFKRIVRCAGMRMVGRSFVPADPKDPEEGSRVGFQATPGGVGFKITEAARDFGFVESDLDFLRDHIGEYEVEPDEAWFTLLAKIKPELPDGFTGYGDELSEDELEALEQDDEEEDPDASGADATPPDDSQ